MILVTGLTIQTGAGDQSDLLPPAPQNCRIPREPIRSFAPHDLDRRRSIEESRIRGAEVNACPSPAPAPAPGGRPPCNRRADPQAARTRHERPLLSLFSLLGVDKTKRKRRGRRTREEIMRRRCAAPWLVDLHRTAEFGNARGGKG
jgi:hypothetical protein